MKIDQADIDTLQTMNTYTKTCQSIGSGAIIEEILTSNIGTGGQIADTLAKERHDPRLRTQTFCHGVEGARQFEQGGGGVLFLPYLTGERTPHMNPQAKGIFLALSFVMTDGILRGQ